MKSYGQRCPLARTLDLVGDRWTLLVIREMLVGPRRYTDLTDGLPGIGSNILAARLAELQSSGIIAKRKLPPPGAATVYELTDAGRELSISLRALSAWGERNALPASEDQIVRPSWVLLGLGRQGLRLQHGQSCELRVGEEVFGLTGDGDEVAVAAAAPPSPDAAAAFVAEDFLELAAGRLGVNDALARAETSGDRRLIRDVTRALAGTGIRLARM